MVNPASLTLPDVLTELDLLAPIPDSSLLLSQPLNGFPAGHDPTLLNFGSSQRLSSSIERARASSTEFLGEDDLDLDIGDSTVTKFVKERDVEVPRDAPPPRSMADELDDTNRLYEGDDLELDIGPDPTIVRDSSVLPDMGRMEITTEAEDINMGGFGDDGLGMDLPGDDIAATSVHRTRNYRINSQSPLSSIRSSAERVLEESLHRDREPTPFEPEGESVQHAHRAKKRKVLQADADTEIHSNQIKAQQSDRSKILKPVSLLPRDPMLMALIEMQKNGGFVSSILGDGRSKGWAPELRGILSLEVVRKTGELKRKRDSGVAGFEEPSSPSQQQPQIQYDQEEDMGMPPGNFELGADTTLRGDDEMFNLPADDGIQPQFDDDESPAGQQSRVNSEAIDLPDEADNFDVTVAPLLHPKDDGPISVGTKHAVHLLRERFDADAGGSPSKRGKTNVLFHDLLPEKTTTKADATKMFFEVLVLATKDAIKVEQADDVLGGPLRIRGKRGLWGSWAEMEAGGEIAAQEVPVVGV